MGSDVLDTEAVGSLGLAEKVHVRQRSFFENIQHRRRNLSVCRCNVGRTELQHRSGNEMVGKKHKLSFQYPK